MRKLLLGLFSLLFIPLISADIIMPIGWSMLDITLIIGIIVIETILFWLILNKNKVKVGPWKSLLIIAIANIITSTIGIMVPIYRTLIYFILVVFILSVIIEWGVYLLFFLKNKNIKVKLFLASVIVNVVSYLFYYVYTLF